MLSIKKAIPQDAELAAGIFMMLWQGHPFQQLKEQLLSTVSGKGAAVFIAYSDGAPAGAAQCSLRYDYVEGPASSPVGSREGLYILPQFRRTGIASRLVRCCESWAKAHGCTEFASGCAADNTFSQQFHEGAGFTEVSRIVCYVKPLESSPETDSEEELNFDKEMGTFFGKE